VRIDAGGGNETVRVSAFKNADGAVAVQVINNSTDSADFELVLDGGKGGANLTSFLTDNENDLKDLGKITAGGNGSWLTTLPARSLVSFVEE
jgi:O-glycosyl hydrolase